jgi:hypothetical protein
VRIERLYVDWPIPCCAYDLRQPLRVVFIGFVEPHLQGGPHAPGVQAFDIRPPLRKPWTSQGVIEPVSTPTLTLAMPACPQNARRDRSRVGDTCAPSEPPALLVHNANRRRLLRHVQPT